jgi:uncharacterized membrane protein
MRFWLKFYARWFVWAFGTILMVTLGVITIIPLTTGYSQWALIVGLFLYFVASLVVFRDDISKLAKK